MKRASHPVLSAALLIAGAAGASQAAAQPDRYDLLIRHGRVVDGSGNPWRYADVAIRGDRIVAVGDLSGRDAVRVIDARNLVVAPGFIDIHSHADGPDDDSGLRSPDARRRAAPNLVMQGITTVVVNQDGRSPPALLHQRRELEALGFGPNVALMIGHGSARAAVLGDDYRRPASRTEIAAMRLLVRAAMEEGAFGLSAGLEYVPGRWSTEDELVALVEEIVPYGGVYIAHQRSEGPDPMWYWPSRGTARPPSLVDAVRETIRIGERTGGTVVASHLKAKGADSWGASAIVVRLIDDARSRGVAVFGDHYPYTTTGSDGSTVLIPGWVFARERRGVPGDYAAALMDALAVDSLVAMIRLDIAHEIRRRGGADRLVVMESPDSAIVGRSLAELAAERGETPVDVAIALQLEGDRHTPGGGILRGFSLDDTDVARYAAQAWTMTASDGWVSLPDDGLTHVRVYGTFPRAIARYGRDRRIRTFEQAVRSATALPAAVLGLGRHGLIREGQAADLVVFDLETLEDRATFFEPHRYPAGVAYVVVNGVLVVNDGTPTWALPGRVLRRDDT